MIRDDQFWQLADAALGRNEREPFGEVQRRIVQVRDDDQVLQILAGPGSGKTEVLIWRVLYELLVRGTEASRLMVTTFTRKAAQELSVRMVERSDLVLDLARESHIPVEDPRVHDLRIGTIHALCDQLLAEFDTDHLEAGTTLIDDLETRIRMAQVRNYLFKEGGRQLLREVIEEEPLAALFRPPWLEETRGALAQTDLALTTINMHVETWIPRCQATDTPNGIEQLHGPVGLTDRLTSIQERWEQYLDENHILDFSGLQKRFLTRQAAVGGQLDHVFVDEFQDTNPIQYAIHLGWVVPVSARVTVVGDDDQALYRFRGSDIACFENLESDCGAAGYTYRRETLEENHRSTRRIIHFSEAFRSATVLKDVGLPKTVRPPKRATNGPRVRLLQGPWGDLAGVVAREARRRGSGVPPKDGDPPGPSTAILLFSTSEVVSNRDVRPARELREVLERGGLRVDNPRNKSAAGVGSPVQTLLALISYLIDPVRRAPAGKGGRLIEVWASMPDEDCARHSASVRPAFRVASAHAQVQKRVRKANGTIDVPDAELRPLLDYIDRVRARLVDATQHGRPVRLTLGGLVARILRMEPFRSSGYTPDLFRQALFTQLLDAQVAPTRQTKRSLETPLLPEQDAGKIKWPDQYWSLLNSFGQIVEAGGVDDVEVEAFAEDAIALLTFHQAKGLEFDHVYVGLTGKDIDPSSVLATKLFSGEAPKYRVEGGQPQTTDREINRLASADRAREIYVALTRARNTLTVLHTPGDKRFGMELNEGLADLFADSPKQTTGTITITHLRHDRRY